MKSLLEIKYVILFIILPFLVTSQDIQFEWKHEFESSGRGKGNSIAVDSENNAYAVGYFDLEVEIADEILTSTGGDDGLLLKLNANGDVIWTKQFTSPEDVNITSIVLDEEEQLLIVGSYSGTVQFDTLLTTMHPRGPQGSTMFIAKFDRNGALIWAKNTWGINYSENQIIIDENNDILISAKALAIEDFANEDFEVPLDSIWITWHPGDPYWSRFYHEYPVIAKFGYNGDFIWCSSSGGNPRDIKTDSENNIILTGYINGLAQEIYGDDNHFYGDSLIEPIGYHTIFLSKHDQYGALAWLRLAGGRSSDNKGNAIVIDSLNSIYFTGQIGGNDVEFGGEIISDGSSYHSFIAKYTYSGEVQWVRDIGTPDSLELDNNHNGGTSLLINSSNELIYSGYFKDSILIADEYLVSEGGSDMMIMKMNLDGDISDAGQYVRYGWTSANNISLGTNDEIYFAGFVDQWNSSLPSQIMVGKIAPDLPTKIEEPEIIKDFGLYPNPVKVGQAIEIQFGEEFSTNKTLMMSDYQGKQILNIATTAEQYRVRIDNAGIYIISIIDQHTIYSKKVLVVE